MARQGIDGLYNHTVQNLVEGVSEQINEARRETQVEEMINCIPQVSRGVMRRNPVDFVSDLKDKNGNILLPEDFFVYTYDRGTVGDQYMILVGNGKWYSFNLSTGTNVGEGTSSYLSTLDDNNVVRDPKEVFSLVTVGDYTWINNSLKTVAMKEDRDLDINGIPVDLTTNHLKNAIIWIKKTDNRIISTDPNTGASTIKGLSYYARCGNAAARVIGGNQPPTYTGYAELSLTYQIAGEMAAILNDGNTQDGVFEFIKSKKYVAAYNINTPDEGEYYVRERETKSTGFRETKYVWNGNVVSRTSGPYTYSIDSRTQDIKRNEYTSKYKYRFYKITRTTKKMIEEVVDTETVGEKFNWKTSGEFIYNNTDFLSESATISVEDGASGSAIFAMKGLVNSAQDLPARLPDVIGDLLVKVDSSKEAETGEEYWLKWNGEYWEESRQEGLLNTIDENTMPHAFIRGSDGLIRFGFYGEVQEEKDVNENTIITYNGSSKWKERKVGDENTAPEPSFVGRKISSIFLHNNRFGILSNDNIIMSELGIYENFWPTTIKTIPETDPIDITAATKDVTALKSAASVSGALLLFSETSQFILTSTGGALTPESAVINNVSSYNYNPLAEANVIGNKIFFTSESGNGTQMFDFELNAVLTTGSENVAANNRSLHIPTYLPTGMDTIIGHSILGYVFMQSQLEPKNIYVLNTLTVDGQGAQSAFHKWTFDHDIIGINIVKNNLNILFKNNTDNKMSITNISLDIPANISLVDYTDDFDGNRTNSYESSIRLSKWQIKDSNGLGTPRGRLQIRTAQIAARSNSEYTVKLVAEELFNITSDWILADGTWNDTGVWEDTNVWTDGFPYKERIYDNDKRVTVASNADKTFMIFQSHRTNKNKGFELATINLEGMFRQRSTRY